MVQRQFQMEHTPLNGDPLQSRYTTHREATTPLRNQHAFISSEVQRGRSLRVPAILELSRGEAEIKDFNRRVRRDVSQRRT